MPNKPWAKESTEYQFQLAEDAAMTKLLADLACPTTAYKYAKELKYSTNYFWRVRATKPAPNDWSPVFSFLTEKEPPPTPAWVWVWILIAIGAFLFLIIILTFKTRRV